MCAARLGDGYVAAFKGHIIASGEGAQGIVVGNIVEGVAFATRASVRGSYGYMPWIA